MKHIIPLWFAAWLTGSTLAILSGCTAKPAHAKERAIAVAKEEVARRGWKNVEIEEARLENGRWVVTLWSLPKTPGGHATVEVSTDGKLLRFVPGL